MDKSYEPKNFEGRIYADWMEKGYFKARVNKDKPPFTIMMPPPNITGQLHVGHAFGDSVQDALIRYKRMKGFEALWLPGTDHASIATEARIVDSLKKEGIDKKELGRDEFLKRAYQWNDKYGGIIFEQLKRMGVSCDWDRAAFTMDENLSDAVLEVFVKLYNKGLIYRSGKIINWCPECKTALSDAEVDHEQSDSKLWYIKYPVVNEKGSFITVATTRPETMLGDVAVAVNPNDKRYKALLGKKLLLPLLNREIPIIADSYVDATFGTGAVKITPAHDPNDFEVGARHSLPIISVMDQGAVMNSEAGQYQGLKRYEARKAILADLEALGLLAKTESHSNNVGHCERCAAVVEPAYSTQWFVKMEELAKPAIEAVRNGEIKILPKRFEKVYYHWLENIKDWCISRQLWWGHRIPAFYCDACGLMEVSKDVLTKCPKCGAALRQDEDVLDTWFSSALWPFSTLGYPKKTEDLDYFYPTSVLVTAYDILFFWVIRMVFSGLEHTGKIPFEKVFFTGLVRDGNGAKMSKSLGNGIDPLEIIDSYGADSLRFALLFGNTPGGDIRLSLEKLEGYKGFMNKIWNASRFVLMNLENADAVSIDKIKDLTLADEWILTKLSECALVVNKSMDKMEIGQAALKLYDFIWTDFCDWYIEMSKTELYSDDRNRRTRTVSVLVHVLNNALKMIHPIIPFVTEEIYQSLPLKDSKSIMTAKFPEGLKSYKKSAAKMESVMELIRAIRNLRAEMNVSQSRRTAIYLMPKNDEAKKLLTKCSAYIEKLASGLSVNFDVPNAKCAKLNNALADVYLQIGELVDLSAEKARLEKELRVAESELLRARGKLSNEGFTSKAPKELLEAERQKEKKYSALVEKLTGDLKEVELD